MQAMRSLGLRENLIPMISDVWQGLNLSFLSHVGRVVALCHKVSWRLQAKALIEGS